MTLAEVETAVREGAHVVAIVFDNERYGMIRDYQDRARERDGARDGPRADRLRGGRAGVRRPWRARRALTRRSRRALRTALAASGPTVIQLALDRRWLHVDRPATAGEAS